jgi:hypothetical protein
MKPMNKAWHTAHPMPEKASIEQRIAWHPGVYAALRLSADSGQPAKADPSVAPHTF